METEKYSPELVTKYVNMLKTKYPEKDSHFLEVAVIQYLLFDCEKAEEPKENLSFIKAKQQNAQTEFSSVLFEGQYKPFESDQPQGGDWASQACNNFEDKNI